VTERRPFEKETVAEENHKKANESPDEGRGIVEPRGEAYEVTFKKSTGELVIKDPKSGHSMTLRGKVDETIEEEDQEVKQLTPEELRTALQRLDALGLTWTADNVPAVKPKETGTDSPFFAEEFEKLREDYPSLPSELSVIIGHVLTGHEIPPNIVGSEDDLEKKSAIVREMLITPRYRSEFFFKHAIKVPYLIDIDWEVVLKLSERNVRDIPGVSYALLSLIFREPSPTRNNRQTTTVAVDEYLVDRLLSIMSDVKDYLVRARQINDCLPERLEPEPTNNATNDQNQSA